MFICLLQCNGQRDPGTFGAIKRLADFTAPIAVNDRKFLDTLKDGAVDVVNAALACDTPTLTLPSKQIETNSQEVISDKKPPLHHIIDENSSVNFHNEDPQPKNSEDVLSNGLEPETSCITNPECNDRNGIEVPFYAFFSFSIENIWNFLSRMKINKKNF